MAEIEDRKLYILDISLLNQHGDKVLTLNVYEAETMRVVKRITCRKDLKESNYSKLELIDNECLFKGIIKTKIDEHEFEQIEEAKKYQEAPNNDSQGFKLLKSFIDDKIYELR